MPPEPTISDRSIRLLLRLGSDAENFSHSLGAISTSLAALQRSIEQRQLREYGKYRWLPRRLRLWLAYRAARARSSRTAQATSPDTSR